MTDFIFWKLCKVIDFYQKPRNLLPVMHLVKFHKKKLWNSNFTPVMIWMYQKKNLDEKCMKARGQDRQGPNHKEFLENVSMNKEFLYKNE